MAIVIDYKAVGEILKVNMRGPIDEIAAKVAANAAANPDLMDDAPDSVDVTSYTTDRAIAVVRINSPLGMMLQAKSGVLTRAAADAGLEVRAK